MDKYSSFSYTLIPVFLCIFLCIIYGRSLSCTHVVLEKKKKTIGKAFSRDKCFSYSIHVILGFVVVSDGKKRVMIVTLACSMTFSQEIYMVSPVSGKHSPLQICQCFWYTDRKLVPQGIIEEYDMGLSMMKHMSEGFCITFKAAWTEWLFYFLS